MQSNIQNLAKVTKLLHNIPDDDSNDELSWAIHETDTWFVVEV